MRDGGFTGSLPSPSLFSLRNEEAIASAFLLFSTRRAGSVVVFPFVFGTTRNGRAYLILSSTFTDFIFNRLFSCLDATRSGRAHKVLAFSCTNYISDRFSFALGPVFTQRGNSLPSLVFGKVNAMRYTSFFFYGFLFSMQQRRLCHLILLPVRWWGSWPRHSVRQGVPPYFFSGQTRTGRAYKVCFYFHGMCYLLTTFHIGCSFRRDEGNISCINM